MKIISGYLFYFAFFLRLIMARKDIDGQPDLRRSIGDEMISLLNSGNICSNSLRTPFDPTGQTLEPQYLLIFHH